MTDQAAIEAIFDAALERPTPRPGPRTSIRMRRDPEVRRQVERLLAAIPGRFFPGTVRGAEATEDHGRSGTARHDHRPLQADGADRRGGHGHWSSWPRAAAVRRKVALKIIKPGMDSREVIARFEAERQALALMDHPNIARVFDAGTTATAGRTSSWSWSRASRSPSTATASG